MISNFPGANGLPFLLQSFICRTSSLHKSYAFQRDHYNFAKNIPAVIFWNFTAQVLVPGILLILIVSTDYRS